MWCLPAGGGEASVLASHSGGWDSVLTAQTSSRVVLGLPVLAGSSDLAEDAAKRRHRRKHKITGTPTLIFADGSRSPGAIPAAQVEKMLATAN